MRMNYVIKDDEKHGLASVFIRLLSYESPVQTVKISA